MIDVVIAGGGPVGLAAALYAVRAGLSVTVHEPRVGVIDKACGEGLMPGAVAALAALGVDPAGEPLRGIRYLAPGRSADAVFRDGPGRGVRRTTVHASLLEAVLAAGVEVVPAAVGRVRQDADGVHAVGPGSPTRARYLLAADGLHSPIRHQLGLDRPTHGPRRFGLRQHFAVAPWTDHVEVHWSGQAEAYVTPVGPRLVGVALLTARRAPFDTQLRDFPELGERLSPVAAPSDSPSDLDQRSDSVRGAGPLRQRARHRVAGRVLLIGDASGYVDALTGEGIALGLAQARAAVAAICAGEPSSYERQWRRVTWRYSALTHALLAASRVPAVRSRLVPAAAALPRVFATAVNELAKPV